MRNIIRNTKFYTKLVIGFVLIFLAMLFSLYCGYTAVATIITLDASKQQEYLSSYAYFTAIIFLIILLVVIISNVLAYRKQGGARNEKR